MKTRLLILFFLLLAWTLPADALTYLGYDFIYDGLKYNIVSQEEHTCATAYQYNFQPGNTAYGKLEIPSVAYDGSQAYTVIGIGNGGFKNSSDLTEIVLPNTLTYIDFDAFDGCYSLTQVTIPASVKTIDVRAFYNTSLSTLYFNAENCENFSLGSNSAIRYNRFPASLTNVVIGENVRRIPAFFLYGCNDVTELTIPESVVGLGPHIVDTENSKLTRLYFNAECCDYEPDINHGSSWCIGGYELENVFFGPNVTKIPASFVYFSKKLTEIVIPESVTEIGKEAFWFNDNLAVVTIPKSVKQIGDRAFMLNGVKTVNFNAEHCNDFLKTEYTRVFPTDVETVVIGESVKRIPANFMYGCNKLLEVDMPSSVTSVGQGAFGNCTSLATVSTPSLEAWLGIDFDDATANPTYCAKKLLVGGETIRRLSIPEGTERINSYAFYNCEQLVTVSIPQSVVSVGNRAFGGCTGLQRVLFPTEESMFRINYDGPESFLTIDNNAKIYVGSEPYVRPEVLEIPASITEIPDYAFYGWDELQQVWLHENVERIGKYAFSHCSNLHGGITINGNVKEVGEYAFSNCSSLAGLYIHASLTMISSGLCKGCWRLVELELPSSLTEICGYAFSGCSSLQYTDLFGTGVEVIGQSAFERCTQLNQISFPETLKTIGDLAFAYCSGLTDLILPDAVTTIGREAFFGCTTLDGIRFGKYLSSIGESAFSACNRLRSMRINNVNDWARIDFKDAWCSPLNYANDLYIGSGEHPVTNLVIEWDSPISDYAFHGAKCIERVRVKDGAPIGANAFEDCTNLREICLNTPEIGAYAFANCSGLQNIYAMNEVAPVASDDVFSKYEGINLYVPANCTKVYENADNCWWRFLDVYESDFIDSDKIFAPDYENLESDIEEVGSDIYAEDAPVEYYNLNGIRVDGENLAPGIYIKRQGNRSEKVAVR